MAQRPPEPNERLLHRDGRRIRVLAYEHESDVVHVIQLGEGTPLDPEQWRASEFLPTASGESPEWTIQKGTTDPPEAPPRRQKKPLQRIKKKSKKRKDDQQEVLSKSAQCTEKRWLDLQTLLEDKRILRRSTRKLAFIEHAKSLRTSWQRLHRIARLAWKNGLTNPEALRARFDLCGLAKRARSEKERAGYKTAGRPRSDGRQSFKVSPEMEKDIIREGLAYLGERRTNNRWGLYGHLVSNLWSEPNEAGDMVPWPQDRRPTVRQVGYIMDKVHDGVDELKRQNSAANFADNFAAKLSNRLTDSVYAGHIYEIDATIVDLWVVSKDDKSVVLGKPTLYLIFDCLTRLLVGFYLTLDPPSWAGATSALLSLAEEEDERKAFCVKYHIKHRPELEPARGVLPHIIRADRGKDVANHGTHIFARGVQRAWENTSGCRGSLKGIVEMGMHLTSVELKNEAFGYQPPREWHKRRGAKYTYDAKLDLDDLHAHLIRYQYKHNAKFHEGMPLPKHIIDAAIPAQPYRVWMHDQETTVGMRAIFDNVLLKKVLMRKVTGTVTPRGIEVPMYRDQKQPCLQYTCLEAEKSNWFVRARKHRFEVVVRYDARLTTVVYVTDPYDDRFEYEATLTPAHREYDNMEFCEAAYRFKLRELTEACAEEFNLAQDVMHRHERAPHDKEIERASREDRRAAGGMRILGTSPLRKKEARDRANAEAKALAGIPSDDGGADDTREGDAPQQPLAPITTRPASSALLRLKKLTADPMALLKGLHHD